VTFDVRQDPDALPRAKLLAVYTTALGIIALSLGAAALVLHLAEPAKEAAPRAPSVAPSQIGTIEQTPIERTARGLEARRVQREALEAWRWVDRDAGVGEIPIDVALDVFLRSTKDAGAD
jgi:hypothetical protein